MPLVRSQLSQDVTLHLRVRQLGSWPADLHLLGAQDFGFHTVEFVSTMRPDPFEQRLAVTPTPCTHAAAAMLWLATLNQPRPPAWAPASRALWVSSSPSPQSLSGSNHHTSQGSASCARKWAAGSSRRGEPHQKGSKKSCRLGAATNRGNPPCAAHWDMSSTTSPFPPLSEAHEPRRDERSVWCAIGGALGQVWPRWTGPRLPQAQSVMADETAMQSPCL